MYSKDPRSFSLSEAERAIDWVIRIVFIIGGGRWLWSKWLHLRSFYKITIALLSISVSSIWGVSHLTVLVIGINAVSSVEGLLSSIAIIFPVFMVRQVVMGKTTSWLFRVLIARYKHNLSAAETRKLESIRNIIEVEGFSRLDVKGRVRKITKYLRILRARF